MTPIRRARNLAAWLGRAPLRDWRIVRADCPHCGGRYAFTMGGHPARSRCLSCRLTGTALALLPVLRDHVTRTGLTGGTAWEMSTHGPVPACLARFGIDTIQTEYLPHAQPGALVNGIRNEDVTAPTFADGTLDLITSNQVFEHVEDDLAGYRACHRILRPGGALIFAVPLAGRQTRKIADTVEGRVVFRGTPEYHASRLTGPDSVPVFWHFSAADLPARVARAGFRAEWRKVPFIPGSTQMSRVLYATKPDG